MSVPVVCLRGLADEAANTVNGVLREVVLESPLFVVDWSIAEVFAVVGELAAEWGPVEAFGAELLEEGNVCVELRNVSHIVESNGPLIRTTGNSDVHVSKASNVNSLGAGKAWGILGCKGPKVLQARRSLVMWMVAPESTIMLFYRL